MTTVNRAEDAELDRLLAELGRTPTPVPDALMARVLDDAAAVQAARAAQPAVERLARPARASWWQRLTEAVGGRGVLAGLGSVAVAGLMLGFVQPAPLADVTDAVWGQTVDVSVELLPAADDLWAEG